MLRIRPVFWGTTYRSTKAKGSLKLPVVIDIQRCDPQQGRSNYRIPQEKLRKFCQSKGYGDYDQYSMNHRSSLLNNSDAEIITIYNAEFRGLVNYYILRWQQAPRKPLESFKGYGLAACSRPWLVNISVQLVVFSKSFGFQRVNMCLPKVVEGKHGRSGYSV